MHENIYLCFWTFTFNQELKLSKLLLKTFLISHPLNEEGTVPHVICGCEGRPGGFQ